MGLDIRVKQSGAVTLLEVSGRLTLGLETEHLRSRVHELFEEGHQWMLLDIGGVQTVDSAGVGELVSVYASIARRGGALKFLHPSRKLRDMFHITHLDNLLEYYDDEQQALAAFGQHSAAKAALVDQQD